MHHAQTWLKLKVTFWYSQKPRRANYLICQFEICFFCIIMQLTSNWWDHLSIILCFIHIRFLNSGSTFYLFSVLICLWSHTFVSYFLPIHSHESKGERETPRWGKMQTHFSHNIYKKHPLCTQAPRSRSGKQFFFLHFDNDVVNHISYLTFYQKMFL